MKDPGVQFHEDIPESDHLKSCFSKGGVLVLDDLKAAELEKRELLDLFTNILIIKISPCCTYAKTYFHQGNTSRVCPETTTTRWEEGILRQCPGVYSLLWAI